MRSVIFKIVFIICFILNSSCVTNKPVVSKITTEKLPNSKDNNITLTLTPHSELSVKQEADGVNYITQKKGLNLVLKFESVKKTPKNVADAGYREVLFIEIPNQKQHLNLSTLKNSPINIWFARFCFCRDYIGFHKIDKGQLSVNLSAHTLKIKAHIALNNLPQVLNFIDQKIQLKP
ncbi:MAG: hypothetical protein L3J45_06990 [Flavobacteriaceae bacterium]|nr:hypothetical protein [Flavobacteriaceae bacterium]